MIFLLAYLLFNIKAPVVALGFQLGIERIPEYLVMSITGTFLILALSQTIDESKTLEFLGRESLIIYVLQINVLCFIEKCLLTYFELESMTSTIGFVILSFSLSLFVLALSSYILNFKYLRIAKGKF